MSKKTAAAPVEEVKPTKPVEYFRLKKARHNMFCLETITIVDGLVTSTESTEETFLPIAFDKFRRKAGEQFFAAVEEE